MGCLLPARLHTTGVSILAIGKGTFLLSFLCLPEFDKTQLLSMVGVGLAFSEFLLQDSRQHGRMCKLGL